MPAESELKGEASLEVTRLYMHSQAVGLTLQEFSIFMWAKSPESPPSYWKLTSTHAVGEGIDTPLASSSPTPAIQFACKRNLYPK